MSPNVKTLKYCKVSEVVFIHRTTPEWGGSGRLYSETILVSSR